MSVWADRPRWPNHGTLWGHLISDSSLDELHAAARALGLPGRAFDLDHYDYPAQLEPTLRVHGIGQLSSRELVTTLGASGLRIPGHARAGARGERTRRTLEQLGLSPELSVSVRDRQVRVQILDLVWGTIGHAEPLDSFAGARLGAQGMVIRVGREADADPHITAAPADQVSPATAVDGTEFTGYAEAVALAVLTVLDAASGVQGGFVGQFVGAAGEGPGDVGAGRGVASR